MRAAICLALALAFSACRDFDKLLADCDAGRGPCAPAGGADGGPIDGGTADGGPSLDAGPLTDAGVADCSPGAAATLQEGGTTAFCFNGFTWENPLPQGSHLSAVWGPSPDDVWAGGVAGMLMHWNGTQWTSHQGTIRPDPPDPRLGSINSIASGRQGTWLAGDDLKPHQLVGSSWIATDAGRPSLSRWRIIALAAPEDGGSLVALTDAGVVLTPPAWNTLYPASGAPNVLRGLALLDDGSCAYSGAFVAGQTSFSRVWSCDGGALWTSDAGHRPGPLWAERGEFVTATTFGDTAGVWVLHGDGGATARPSQVLNDSFEFFGATFVSSRDTGLLVGAQRTITDTWAITLSGPPADISAFRGVWAFADGGAWAVGANGALSHEEQGSWARHDRGFTQTLFGLWVDDDGGVFFSGEGGALFERGVADPVVFTNAGALRDLHRLGAAEWLVASDDGNLYRSGSGTPVYQDPTPDPYDHALTSLLVDGDEGWATGDNTLLHQLRDGGWVSEAVDAGEWWGISRAGSRFLFVGGAGTVLVHTLDGGWASFSEPNQSTLYGVWTIDPAVASAWVVGNGIWRFDGDLGTFTSAAVAFTGSLYDVWGSAPDDVWAVGDDGLAFHYDGASWSLLETGTRTKFERVRTRPLPNGGRELIIVGEFGAVLRKRY